MAVLCLAGEGAGKGGYSGSTERMSYGQATPTRSVSLHNLGIFGEHISGYKPAKHHQEWIDAIVTKQDSAAMKQS